MNEPPRKIPFGEALRVWLRVAALSFGGPAGQIAVMHRILVDEKRWIGENRFLHALNYCMFLPGPEAQQLATYIGWLLGGTRGGLLAGGLFIAPGFLSILALSILYTQFHDFALVRGLFFGLQPAVVAIVVEAVLRIGKRALKNRVMVAIAAAAWIAIFFFQVPFPAIILTAGLVGLIGAWLWPAQFVVLKGAAVDEKAEAGTGILEVGAAIRPTWRRAAIVAATWLLLWWTPVAAIWALTGPKSVYTQEALFFSKTAVVTFGGAYSVLAYIAQQGVDRYQWITSAEMLDGLGMAETTPGPLIMVVQFIGFLGASRDPGALSPLAAGIAGSIIAVWVTFAPCFLWIFLGAPYVERVRHWTSLSAALSAITAAVVGVVLNLSLWFSLHSLFGVVEEHYLCKARLLVPDLSTIKPVPALLTVAALVAMLRFKVGLPTTLAASTVLGMAYYLLAG